MNSKRPFITDITKETEQDQIFYITYLYIFFVVFRRLRRAASIGVKIGQVSHCPKCQACIS